jgi:hypothetical protein
MEAAMLAAPSRSIDADSAIGDRYDPALFVTYSRDAEAVEALRYWQSRRHALPFWKRRERAEATTYADEAWQRCIAAGIDWNSVPQPPRDFKAPDRSTRPTAGRAFSATETRSDREYASDRPRRRDDARPALTGGAAGVAGGLAGAGVWSWIHGGAHPVHESSDGSAFFESPDGSYWYADSAGNVFGLAEDGSWLALDGEGFLWGLDAGGNYVSWAADGTLVNLAGDGSLVAFAADGSAMTLGEDGSWFFDGADGSMYTADAEGHFWGIDDEGNYFEAPDGSGFSHSDLAAADLDGLDGAGVDGEDGGWLELFS